MKEGGGGSVLRRLESCGMCRHRDTCTNSLLQQQKKMVAPFLRITGTFHKLTNIFLYLYKKLFFFFIFLRTFREIAVMKNEIFPSFPFQAN